MDAVDIIRRRQVARQMMDPRDAKPAEHNPSILYFGGLDDNFFSNVDLGFQPGEALIHRTKGAKIYGMHEEGRPIDLREAATLQFAVNVKKVGHIIVSGSSPDLIMESARNLVKYDFMHGVFPDRIKLSARLFTSTIGEIQQASIIPGRSGELKLGHFEMVQIKREHPPVSLFGSKHQHPRSKKKLAWAGCVDARLDPITDVGLEDGWPIYRTIGALFGGLDEAGRARYPSEEHDLRYLVETLKVNTIFVAPHTCCGGNQACLGGCNHSDTNYLHQYLSPFSDLATKINKAYGSEEERIAAFEEGAARLSLKNLLSHDFVRRAVEGKQLRLLAGVLDTGTKRIKSELDLGIGGVDPESGKFGPMKLAAKYHR